MKWIQQDVQTYYDVYKCSNCGEHIGLKSHRFCAYCGQALDWSDTK